MQLVSDRICVLNPPKDNLICDAAKVEEILGVPPERVVDVMALRGDSIDNIPGAPGIGDKGSVELIQRFGSVESGARPCRRGRAQNLSRVAAEQSRGHPGQQEAGDHRHATSPSTSSRKRCGRRSPMPPPHARCLPNWSSPRWCRTFCSESIELGETDYRDAKAAADVEGRCGAASKVGRMLAIALESSAQRRLPSTDAEEATRSRRASSSRCRRRCRTARRLPSQLRVAISAEAGKALSLTLDDSATAASR